MADVPMKGEVWPSKAQAEKATGKCREVWRNAATRALRGNLPAESLVWNSGIQNLSTERATPGSCLLSRALSVSHFSPTLLLLNCKQERRMLNDIIRKFVHNVLEI
jgi:hypothetical protein